MASNHLGAFLSSLVAAIAGSGEATVTIPLTQASPENLAAALGVDLEGPLVHLAGAGRLRRYEPCPLWLHGKLGHTTTSDPAAVTCPLCRELAPGEDPAAGVVLCDRYRHPVWYGTVLEHNASGCPRALAVGMRGCAECRCIVTADGCADAEDPAWELGDSALPPGTEPIDFGDSGSHGRGMAGDPCGPG